MTTLKAQSTAALPSSKYRTPVKTLLQCLDLEFSAESRSYSVVIGPVKLARFSVTEANLRRLTLCHQYSELISQKSGRKTVTGPEPPSHGIWWGYVDTPEGATGR